jgi:hypothetical protein
MFRQEELKVPRRPVQDPLEFEQMFESRWLVVIQTHPALDHIVGWTVIAS